MENTIIEAKSRDGQGKGDARRLRAQGLIPAVIYGKSQKAPTHIAIDPIAVRKAVATSHKLNTLLTLKVAGGSDTQVLLKDFQQDPVSRALLHADFLAVKKGEQVKVKVPVNFTGKAEGVANGGIFSVQRRELEVWAMPDAIPDQIDVDVTHLKIAQALHINDIKLPSGVTVKTNVNYTLAVVAVPEKEEVAAPVAAAAPAAGGAAPAAGAAAPTAGAAAPAAGAKKEEKKK